MSKKHCPHSYACTALVLHLLLMLPMFFQPPHWLAGNGLYCAVSETVFCPFRSHRMIVHVSATFDLHCLRPIFEHRYIWKIKRLHPSRKSLSTLYNMLRSEATQVTAGGFAPRGALAWAATGTFLQGLFAPALFAQRGAIAETAACHGWLVRLCLKLLQLTEQMRA
eukprot:scaffold2980_cov20-Tisochrysis_lutea.AAC.2